jgi:hypothetical protein
MRAVAFPFINVIEHSGGSSMPLRDTLTQRIPVPAKQTLVPTPSPARKLRGLPRLRRCRRFNTSRDPSFRNWRKEPTSSLSLSKPKSWSRRAPQAKRRHSARRPNLPTNLRTGNCLATRPGSRAWGAAPRSISLWATAIGCSTCSLQSCRRYACLRHRNAGILYRTSC